MEQIPSGEDNSLSSKQISHLLRNQKVRKGPQMVPWVTWIKFTVFLKVPFWYPPTYASVFEMVSSLQVLWPEFSIHFSCLPCMLCAVPISSSLTWSS